MNSRQKGKRGEREWAKVLTDMGFRARRGVQFSGGEDSPDVVGGFPGTHAEVKRVEQLNLHAASDQASRDAGAKKVPYVAHRKNGQPWLVTVKAEDLLRFCQAVVAAEQQKKEA